MRYLPSIFSTITLIVLMRLLWTVITVAGVFLPTETVINNQCIPIEIAPGTEDIAIDHETGALFISAAQRRDWYLGEDYSDEDHLSEAQNGIYFLDPQDRSEVIKVSPENFGPFFPHGISLWRGKNGVRRLFVVNHPGGGIETVEIFSVDLENRLTHIETISFDAMYSPNDVVAVGPRQFYVTNDRAFDKGLMSILELYLAFPLTTIAYFDGVEGHVAAEGLTYANGINQSLDGRSIYVAEFLRQSITVFDRNQKTGDLSKERRFKVRTGPDNIDISSDGKLWIAGHPKALEFQKHAKNPDEKSTSHVISLDPKTGDVETTFLSPYGEINGSSVGAVDRGHLYIGAVFESHILDCPL